MQAVKEKVASLEKKLAIVEISFDNEHSTDPMPEAPFAHEPQQPPFIESVIPDPTPALESECFTEPIIPNPDSVPAQVTKTPKPVHKSSPELVTYSEPEP